MCVQTNGNEAKTSWLNGVLAGETRQDHLQDRYADRTSMQPQPASHVVGTLKTGLDLRRQATGAKAILALVGAGLLAAFVAGAPAQSQEMPNAMRPRNQQHNCLSMDANGKTLPNPNVSFNCQQNDALRLDCELMRLRSTEPVMNNVHCFNWRMEDVRPGAGTPTNPSTRGQTTGGH